MKTVVFACLAALLAAGCQTQEAGAAAGAPHRTEVTFDHPEKFTDVKDRSIPTDKGRDYILSQIREFIVQTGDKVLPAGDHLAMTFQDIDLAGDFEPWHGAQWDDVRVIKEIYPPRFKFSYTVTNASGQVIKKGQENDTDMDFQLQPILDNQDSLRYEKAFLGSWMRSHLARLKG